MMRFLTVSIVAMSSHPSQKSIQMLLADEVHHALPHLGTNLPNLIQREALGIT